MKQVGPRKVSLGHDIPVFFGLKNLVCSGQLLLSLRTSFSKSSTKRVSWEIQGKHRNGMHTIQYNKHYKL